MIKGIEFNQKSFYICYFIIMISCNSTLFFIANGVIIILDDFLHKETGANIFFNFTLFACFCIISNLLDRKKKVKHIKLVKKKTI